MKASSYGRGFYAVLGVGLIAGGLMIACNDASPTGPSVVLPGPGGPQTPHPGNLPTPHPGPGTGGGTTTTTTSTTTTTTTTTTTLPSVPPTETTNFAVTTPATESGGTIQDSVTVAAVPGAITAVKIKLYMTNSDNSTLTSIILRNPLTGDSRLARLFQVPPADPLTGANVGTDCAHPTEFSTDGLLPFPGEAVAPYEGIFQPTGPAVLTTFNGLRDDDVNDVWTLTIDDTSTGATLECWTLSITSQPDPPVAP